MAKTILILATSYNNLAELYETMGDYKKAESLYIKALKIRGTVLGKDHPNTAAIYNNLAWLYFEQKEYQKADDYIKQAIDIWQKTLPENHPNLLGSKQGLEMIKGKLNQ